MTPELDRLERGHDLALDDFPLLLDPTIPATDISPDIADEPAFVLIRQPDPENQYWHLETTDQQTSFDVAAGVTDLLAWTRSLYHRLSIKDGEGGAAATAQDRETTVAVRIQIAQKLEPFNGQLALLLENELLKAKIKEAEGDYYNLYEELDAIRVLLAAAERRADSLEPQQVQSNLQHVVTLLAAVISIVGPYHYGNFMERNEPDTSVQLASALEQCHDTAQGLHETVHTLVVSEVSAARSSEPEVLTDTAVDEELGMARQLRQSALDGSLNLGTVQDGDATDDDQSRLTRSGLNAASDVLLSEMDNALGEALGFQLADELAHMYNFELSGKTSADFDQRVNVLSDVVGRYLDLAGVSVDPNFVDFVQNQQLLSSAISDVSRHAEESVVTSPMLPVANAFVETLIDLRPAATIRNIVSTLH